MVFAGFSVAEATTATTTTTVDNCDEEFITVVDEEAWTEEIPGTPNQWWNFSPNDTRGPFQGTPSFPTDPGGTWQGPHTSNPGHFQVGTYQVGNGNGDWFHGEAGTPTTYVDHPAVTHQEPNPNYPCVTTTVPTTTEAPTTTEGPTTTVPNDPECPVDEAPTPECPPAPPVVEGCEAQHFSLTGNGDWQANTHQEPHLNNPNVTWLGTVGEGLHYTSHGSSGNFDWFFFYPGNPDDCDPCPNGPDGSDECPCPEGSSEDPCEPTTTTVVTTTVPPTTVPPTTVPPTTEPPVTTEPPPPPFTVVPPPPPAPPAELLRLAPPVEQLPRTGGTVLPLAIAGALMIGIGLAIRRFGQSGNG
jgi:hypothetical protein